METSIIKKSIINWLEINSKAEDFWKKNFQQSPVGQEFQHFCGEVIVGRPEKTSRTFQFSAFPTIEIPLVLESKKYYLNFNLNEIYGVDNFVTIGTKNSNLSLAIREYNVLKNELERCKNHPEDALLISRDIKDLNGKYYTVRNARDRLNKLKEFMYKNRITL